MCVADLAAFATGDADAVAAHVAEGFLNEHTAALGEGSVGRDEYRQRLPWFIASMPGLRYEIEDVVATHDRVMIAYTLRATVNDREIAVRGVMRFVVDGEGLIARRVDYWDSTVFRQQAGLD
jgi:predicted ester cyclase